MMFRKQVIPLMLTLVMALNLATLGSLSTFAHETMLEIDYDSCITTEDGDGIDEMWYMLDQSAETIHISHETQTIKYFFLNQGVNDGCTWTPEGQADDVGDAIKTSFAESMEKWNNVYFYSQNADGSVAKNKIINIVEGTMGDFNVLIIPDTTIQNVAEVYEQDNGMQTIETGSIAHNHYSEWVIFVNINHFFEGNYVSAEGAEAAEAFLERTGAHEVGHILGLCDIDTFCDANEEDHHHEVLMGYGYPAANRAVDITYKDIAGVAITRGFHTDNDHKWLNCGMQSDGTYKLICSICNGVKYVDSLSGYTYKTYGACDNNHTLSDGNMMAVASYGTKDYYKCEYCRYVAPFASIVEQDYSETYHNITQHKCVNQVDGLEYTCYEEHVYDDCVYFNKVSHQMRCACGARGELNEHAISAADLTPGVYFAPCMGCGFLLDMRGDMYETIMSITQVSINGSYVLPSGIIVLVDEDIQAYWDGTLVFYHPDDLPVTQ